MPVSPMHPVPLATIETVPVAVWGPQGTTLKISVRVANNHSNLYARFTDCGINPPPDQDASHTLLDAEALLAPGGCIVLPFAEITWKQNAPAGFVWEDTLDMGLIMQQGEQGPPATQEIYTFARYVAIVSST